MHAHLTDSFTLLHAGFACVASSRTALSVPHTCANMQFQLVGCSSAPPVCSWVLLPCLTAPRIFRHMLNCEHWTARIIAGICSRMVLLRIPCMSYTAPLVWNIQTVHLSGSSWASIRRRSCCSELPPCLVSNSADGSVVIDGCFSADCSRCSLGRASR